MGYTSRARMPVVLALLPSAHGIWMTAVAWHEMLGLAWYRLRFLLS